jgi:GTP-binding protein YchF
MEDLRYFFATVWRGESGACYHPEFVMLRAGLIGLPASGKTTIFELLTRVHEAPRTHGKAEANVGVSKVPDARLDQLTALFQPKKRVPATVEFADMAAGRGDAKSLVDVVAYRNADALLHVVRAFRDASVPHSQTTVDPVRDARMVEEELILADLGSVERRLERLEKDLKKTPSPELKAEQALLLRGRELLEGGRALRTLGLSAADTRILRGFQFLSAKPMLVVINLDEADLPHADRAAEHTGLAAFLAETGAAAVGVCARIELEISQLEPADAAAFMADLGLTQSGLDRVIRAAYDLLGYMSFFTVGEDECRAWSIPKEMRAQDAAGAIHSDIQRGFIRAEVVHCDTLLSRGSLAACRDNGELRLEGKDYIVQDGDTINFRHAT